MDVPAILKQHSRPVYSVSNMQTVDDAVKLMAAKKVNALIVTDKKQPVGIFAERDVFRYYLLDKKRAFADLKLESAMTNRLISAKSTDGISELITVMIRSDLEHLPVIEDNKIIGLLAFKDLVESHIDSLTDEINRLKDYIDDLHDAGRD